MAKGHDRQARHAAYRSLAFSRSAVASLAGGIPKRDFHATEHRGLPAAARTVALHLRVEAGIRVEARTRSKRTRSARRLWGPAGSRIRRECGREGLRRPRSWLSSTAGVRSVTNLATARGGEAGAGTSGWALLPAQGRDCRRRRHDACRSPATGSQPHSLAAALTVVG